MRENKYQRKGISPIIATLTLIAVTLVAAVAIGGFVFGIFGSQTSTAQVSVTYAYIPHDVPLGTLQITTQAPQGTYGIIALQNLGTANVAVNGVSLTYGGSTKYASLSEPAPLNSGGTVTLYITSLPTDAVAGQQFTGVVVLSNGAQIPFSGTFA
jgi:flagellin-like protein